MSTTAFQKVLKFAQEGILDAKAAASLGFDWVSQDEADGANALEALVLGAGPAGFGFVKGLLDEGVLQPNEEHPPVLVLECGETLGCRSVYGGAFWPKDPVIFSRDPDFFRDCPRDRTIAPRQDHLAFINTKGGSFHPLIEASTFLRNSSAGLMVPKTVLYPWLWSRIEEKRLTGFFRLRLGVSADKLIVNDQGRVVGVRTTAGQRFFAKLVVDGTGAGATFARNLASRPLNNENGDYFFGVKAVVRLDNTLIRARFGLKNDSDGCVREYVGEISAKIPELPGMIALYPGNGTVHVNVIFDPRLGPRLGMQPHEIFNECMQNPLLRQMLEGCEALEWSACRMPEIHVRHMPEWCHPGYLPLGDALGLVDFLRKHGVNIALACGALGANCFARVLEQKSATISATDWENALRRSWIGKRILGESFRKIHGIISNPKFYTFCAKLGKTLGMKAPKTAGKGLSPRSLADWIGLNATPTGQPEIFIRNPSICAACVSEACRYSDPCLAVNLDRTGVPVFDAEPSDRPEWKALRKNPLSWKSLNSEGCLECGNCESACPWGNLVYQVPNNLRGKHGVRNRGITYRYN
jgi:flavin-dependent dehydrogenase/ferredoxin